MESFLEVGRIEAGCDEAGRGCLAGPVVAAAVILPKDFSNEEINDSKKLSEKKRTALKRVIEADVFDFGVAFINNEEIDQLNILRASFKAMHKAVEQLKTIPQHLLIDGNRFVPYKDIPYSCIIKGDGKFSSIAAASILAKTYRDAYMLQLHQDYPQYGWDSNKGYPTKKHFAAIKEYGLTPYHRKSFNTGSNQLEIKF